MANLLDSPNPLRSALAMMKARNGSEKENGPKWDRNNGTLAGDDYPELKPKVEAIAPEPLPESISPELAMEALVQEGRLRELDAAHLGPVLMEMLNGGMLSLFLKAVDRIRLGLESDAPEERRWALESVRALITLDDLSLVPYGTLPLMLDCVGRALMKEERVELRESALEITALLLGTEAVHGDLESAHAHLTWLERVAKAGGTDYAARILSSRSLVVLPLELFCREGHAVLEGRVLPFFRFVGEPAARTLVQLLDEERSRQRRNRILELLKLLHPLSFPALQEGLVAGSWHLVRNALNLVGELQEAQAFEYIVPCLEHADSRVVHSAIRALWKAGGARAERYLLEMLPRADAETQGEVLQGLAQIKSVGSIPAVGSLASKGPEAIRIKAIETLGAIKHQDAVPILETHIRRRGHIFKSAEPLPVRVAAAKALLSIGTQEARRILDQVVSDEPKGPDQEALRTFANEPRSWT